MSGTTFHIIEVNVFERRIVKQLFKKPILDTNTGKAIAIDKKTFSVYNRNTNCLISPYTHDNGTDPFKKNQAQSLITCTTITFFKFIIIQTLYNIHY